MKEEEKNKEILCSSPFFWGSGISQSIKINHLLPSVLPNSFTYITFFVMLYSFPRHTLLPNVDSGTDSSETASVWDYFCLISPCSLKKCMSLKKS